MGRRKIEVVVATPATTGGSKHKRQASRVSAAEADPTETPTRSSKRLKTSPTTTTDKYSPKKSKYFEHSESESESSTGQDPEESNYESNDAGESQSGSPTADEEDDYDSTEEHKAAPRRNKTKQTSQLSAQAMVKGKQDLWREGVKTGLGPGKAVYIEKPKARGDGGIPYVPDRVHPHTFEFLKDLKKNNDRIWLKAHDADYRTSWKDFEAFVEALTERIAEIDETIPELPPKDLVFRIYRDIRFSSDPTPYKPHFSAAWSRTGRKGPYACYYVHIQPGQKSFVGSGLWHPLAEPIALLRADIDQQPDRILSVLVEPAIRKKIFGGIGKDAKKAIKAFCKQNEENALKTKPKGFDANHPNIDLLRLRNFTIGQKITDEDILSSEGIDRVLDLVRAMQPFVSYLNSVVMPDQDVGQEDVDDQSSSESELASE